MKTIIYMLSLLAFFTVGCGIYGMTKSDPKPTQAQISSADFGSPPENYQEKVKAYFQANLVNPVGMILEFGQPHKAWARLPKDPTAKFAGTYGYKNVFGWAVCGYMNTQNRFGGYTGRDMFWSFFRDGELLSINYGTPAWDSCRGNEPKL